MSGFKEIWIYAPISGGTLDKSVFGLIAKTQEMIEGRADWQICALVYGGEAAKEAAGELAKYVRTVHAFAAPEFETPDYMRYASALMPLIEKNKPEIIVFGVSNFNSVLAAVLGVRAKTGVIAHATDMRLDDEGRVVGVIPAFGGEFMGDILCPEHRPQIIGVRASGGRLQTLAVPGAVEIHTDVPPADDRYEYEGQIVAASEGTPIEDAEVIVCGGMGVGSAENWALLKEVADLLGATVASTRPPIDEGWAESEKSMIGTSGKYVSPKVYIGFGVSGSSHHVCGMKDSGKIFNINKDEKALSLALSDYAVVGDVGEYLTALRDALKS